MKSIVEKVYPKIIAVGRNYVDHAKQLGNELPTQPIIFLKPWTSLVYSPKLLSLPLSKSHPTHHEVQLGVYITKGGKDIQTNEAMNHVGGFFLGIDVTDRQLQKKGGPWQLGKGQDNFAPVSQFFKTEKPYSILLQLSVNGTIRQSGKTEQMVFKIDETISFVSKYMTLCEGDMLFTGTPAGVGPLLPGDEVIARAKQGQQVLAQLQFKVTE